MKGRADMKILDPICDMVVDLADARQERLSMEFGGREYGFCSPGCLAKFAKSPEAYAPKVDAWLGSAEQPEHHAAHAHPDELPVIDTGMREWYKSCRCCLSEAYPKVVEALDAEKTVAG